MNPKRGLSSAAKAGVVVLVIVIVLGGAYLIPSLSKGSGTSTTSSQSLASGSNPGGGNQTLGLLSLFGYFHQMQMMDIVNTLSQQDGAVQQQTLSYIVLGTATFNSTQHTKVQFSETGVANEVVAWFNPTGVVDRLDVIGARNYTGPGAAILAQTYTTAFSVITAITNNSTLLSFLSKTSENTTTIGSTQLDVATYHLAVPTPPYKTITVEYATIPGTNQKLAVYLDEKTIDGAETTVQVLSLTK